MSIFFLISFVIRISRCHSSEVNFFNLHTQRETLQLHYQTILLREVAREWWRVGLKHSLLLFLPNSKLLIDMSMFCPLSISLLPPPFVLTSILLIQWKKGLFSAYHRKSLLLQSISTEKLFIQSALPESQLSNYLYKARDFKYRAWHRVFVRPAWPEDTFLSEPFDVSF